MAMPGEAGDWVDDLASEDHTGHESTSVNRGQVLAAGFPLSSSFPVTFGDPGNAQESSIIFSFR